MNALTISEDELATLNDRHIGANDKWLRMFMGIASQIIHVTEGTIQLQVIYSNPVRESKADTVARTWLKAPKNAVLRQAVTVEVIEYTDRGSPGQIFLLHDSRMDFAEGDQFLDPEGTTDFGKTKRFLDRKVFTVDDLLHT